MEREQIGNMTEAFVEEGEDREVGRGQSGRRPQGAAQSAGGMGRARPRASGLGEAIREVTPQPRQKCRGFYLPPSPFFTVGQ